MRQAGAVRSLGGGIETFCGDVQSLQKSHGSIYTIKEIEGTEIECTADFRLASYDINCSW